MLSALKINLEQTVGIPYELLCYHNDQGKGICAIYNRGIADAKYSFLCFMHEDIIIQTKNWGNIVTDIFQQNPQVGLVGVAGSCYKPLSPCGWLGRDAGTEYSNLIQAHKYSPQGNRHHYMNPDNSNLPQVTCLDGLWLCVPRYIALEYRFDEDTFKGFHGYDLDFCLNVGHKYRLVVTYDVLMEHLSEGKFDHVWMQEMLKLHQKWHRHLPVNINNYPLSKVIRIEKLTFRYLLKQLKSCNISLIVAGKLLWQQGLYWRLSPKLFFSLQNTLLRESIKEMF